MMAREVPRRLLAGAVAALVAAAPCGRGAAQTPTPVRTIQWGMRTPAATATTAPATTPATPATVYISVAKAPLRDGESPTSRTIAELPKGTALRVLSTSGACGSRLRTGSPDSS